MELAVAIRGFRSRDQRRLANLQVAAFAGLEYVPRVRADVASSLFDPDGFFVAEEHGAAVGCIAVLNLPRSKWNEIRYLAVRDIARRPAVGESLIEAAVAHAESRGAEYLKAMSLAVPPYVEMFERSGFRPVRRTLRLSWDLTKRHDTQRKPHAGEFRDLTQADANKLVDLFVEGHLPYWDWWIEERGGKDQAGDWLRHVPISKAAWIAAIRNGTIAGYVGFGRDFYGPGEARLQVYCVLPEFRGQGIGSALLMKILQRAKKVGQKKLIIYTVAYLDGLAPGAIAYLKSGATIEAEYLQLRKP